MRYYAEVWTNQGHKMGDLIIARRDFRMVESGWMEKLEEREGDLRE